MSAMEDRDLIAAYAKDGSEAAFSELVHRHLAWVYSVARRHVGDPTLAEDVTQAVFVLLARKAGTLRSEIVLGGWLFNTTRFVANRALRAEKRRRTREEMAAAMTPTKTPFDRNEAELWTRLEFHLDEAVASLSESDRRAVLLRFYQKKSLLEVGQSLGSTEEAAKKRVSRAIHKMRAFLLRQGVAVGATGLVSFMTEHAVQAAPSSLANSVLRTSAVSVVPSGMPRLALEILNVWRWTKLKMLGGLAAALCAIAWLCFAQAPRSNSGESANNQMIGGSEPTRAATVSLSPGAAQPPEPAGRVLHFRVLAKNSEEPVVGAALAVNTVSEGGWKQRFDLATDQSGSAKIPYPSSTMRLDVGVVASGWTARFATWWTDLDGEIPSDYTLRVDRQTNFMSGWLRNENGEPVADAIIEMEFGGSDMAQEENPRERPGFVGPAPVARSDPGGRWSCAVVDPSAGRLYGLRARHLDFAPTQIVSSSRPNRQEPPNAKLLWDGTLVTTMRRGVTLAGRIVGARGEALRGARIEHRPSSSNALVTETDPLGAFAFRGLPPGDFDFIVTAPGFAQSYTNVNVQPAMAPVEVRLKPGALLRALVLDHNGNAVENAAVALTGPGGMYMPELNWSALSGPDGKVEWTSAHTTNALTICVSKGPEFGMSRATVKADGTEHVIRLRPKFVVSGWVLDARTGEQVQGEIKAFPGYGNGISSWYRGETHRSTDGSFRVYFGGGELPWRYRVEAQGYSPFVSEFAPNREATRVLTNVYLQPADVSRTVRGRVLRADGQPAARAQIALLTPQHGAFLGRGRFARRSAVDRLIVDADEAGGFAFPEEPQASSVVAVSSNGFARLPLGDVSLPLEIRLKPWGRIEGAIDPSARTYPVDSVSVDDLLAMDAPGGLMLEREDFTSKPASDGRFFFDFVPEGLLCVWLAVGTRVNEAPRMPVFHHPVWVQVAAGETARARIVENGFRVTGRLLMSGSENKALGQPTYAILEHERPAANSPGPNARQWMQAFFDLGRLIVAPDGAFESRDPLIPGTYRLLGKIDGNGLDRQVEIPHPDRGDMLRAEFDFDPADPQTIDVGDIVIFRQDNR